MAENKKISIKDLETLYSKQKQISEQQIALLEDELKQLSNVFDIKKRIAIQQEINNEKLKISAAMQDAYIKASEEGYVITKKTTDAFNRRIKHQQEIIVNNNKIIKNQQNVLKLQDSIATKTKLVWKYLMDSDKVIRQTILNLGMSSAKAEEMRTSFELSSGYVARLGGNLSDVQSIMEGFANETGRARVLSSEMVKDVFLIGKGTGLGVEQGVKLAAQFESMGLNARAAMKYAEGVVETSELMGINTNKVLKNISENFRKLQTYTFSKGVKGFAEMAMYSEKMHIDMSQALDSARVARGLEGAIDMAAQLQVMGGEFAKTDPFQMLYLARNAPDEFTKKINEMTKGVVTFRKMADGSFEHFISPADIDRLSSVEKSLGLQSGELIKQSHRMAEIQLMRRQMVGMGLSDTEKKLIEGMSTFNTQTGRFSVQVAGISKDMTELTTNELKILQRQSKSLEERAKNAQTFDDAFKATIDEFKTILLPLLRGVNIVLEKVRPIAISVNEWITKMSQSQGGWLKVAGTLLGAGALWKMALQPLIGGGLSKLIGLLGKIPTGIGSKIGGRIPKKTPISSAGGTAGLKGGAGIGAAGLGIGAGIGIAAEGISSLADSMSKLDEKQAKILSEIVKNLTILSGIAAGAAVITTAIIAFGAASTAVAPGLWALGGSFFLIGAGIGVAALGIGKMGDGLSKLVGSGKGVGDSLFKIAGGIGAISASLVGMTVGGFGLPVFAATLGLISRKSGDLEKIGSAFGNINSVLRGSRDNFKDVERMITNISNANFNNLKQLSNINNLFNKPLKVEFADKEVALVSNITFNVDGYKFMEKIGTTGYVTQRRQAISQGKESERGI
jgi:hypothetical protein